MPCVSEVVSASCAAGGTHSTKSESNDKIFRDAASNTWLVFKRNGIRLTFASISTWGSSVDPSDDDPNKIRNEYR